MSTSKEEWLASRGGPKAPSTAAQEVVKVRDQAADKKAAGEAYLGSLLAEAEKRQAESQARYEAGKAAKEMLHAGDRQAAQQRYESTDEGSIKPLGKGVTGYLQKYANQEYSRDTRYAYLADAFALVPQEAGFYSLGGWALERTTDGLIILVEEPQPNWALYSASNKGGGSMREAIARAEKSGKTSAYELQQMQLEKAAAKAGATKTSYSQLTPSEQELYKAARKEAGGSPGTALAVATAFPGITTTGAKAVVRAQQEGWSDEQILAGLQSGSLYQFTQGSFDYGAADPSRYLISGGTTLDKIVAQYQDATSQAKSLYQQRTDLLAKYGVSWDEPGKLPAEAKALYDALIQEEKATRGFAKYINDSLADAINAGGGLPSNYEYLLALAENKDYVTGVTYDASGRVSGINFDVVAALKAGVGPAKLQSVGITGEGIEAAQTYLGQLREYELALAAYKGEIASREAILSKLSSYAAPEGGYYIGSALIDAVVTKDELLSLGYTPEEISSSIPSSITVLPKAPWWDIEQYLPSSWTKPSIPVGVSEFEWLGPTSPGGLGVPSPAGAEKYKLSESAGLGSEAYGYKSLVSPFEVGEFVFNYAGLIAAPTLLYTVPALGGQLAMGSVRAGGVLTTGARITNIAKSVGTGLLDVVKSPYTIPKALFTKPGALLGGLGKATEYAITYPGTTFKSVGGLFTGSMRYSPLAAAGITNLRYGLVGRTGLPVTGVSEYGIPPQYLGEISAEQVAAGMMKGGPTVNIPFRLVGEGPVNLLELGSYRPLGSMTVFGEMGLTRPAHQMGMVEVRPGVFKWLDVSPLRGTGLQGEIGYTKFFSPAPGLKPSLVPSGGSLMPSELVSGLGMRLPISPEWNPYLPSPVRTLVPTLPLTGTGTSTLPSTATMTPEAVERQLASLGFVAPIFDYSLSWGVSSGGLLVPQYPSQPGRLATPLPSVWPVGAPTPAPSPGVTPVTYPSVGEAPAPVPGPTPVPELAPAPVTPPIEIPPIEVPPPEPPKPPEPPPPVFIPPPEFGEPELQPSRRFKGGIAGLLKGERWLMPGMILYMPEPFGTGKRQITLARKRARKYGASVPRGKLAVGGLRL